MEWSNTIIEEKDKKWTVTGRIAIGSVNEF